GLDQNVVLAQKRDRESVVGDHRPLLSAHRLEAARLAYIQAAVQCDPEPFPGVEGQATDRFGRQPLRGVVRHESSTVEAEQATVGAHPEITSGIGEQVARGEIRQSIALSVLPETELLRRSDSGP